MITLIRAELLKLRTVRSTWWLDFASLPAIAGVTVGTILVESAAGGALDAGEPGIHSIMSSPKWAALLALLLGVLVATGEFRHGTATATFLTTPHRWRVLLAKAAAVVITSAYMAFGVCGVTVAIAVPWLSSLGFENVHDAGIWAVLARSAASITLNGLLGFGIGVLIRNQAAAVTIAFLWTLLVEPTIGGVLPHVYQWLPGGGEAALVGWDAAVLLPAWGGGLVLLGWAAALVVLGSGVVARRDLL